MKKCILFVCVLSAFIIFSCKAKNNRNTERKTSEFLLGYWIPQQIKWGGDDQNSKDTGDVFRTADFLTLCFDTTNKFIYFGSTQRHPRDYNDSIIFAGEPIVNVFTGNWKLINDTSLLVNYKPIEYEINPPDTTERHEQIKIIFEKDTLLLFENEIYKRTDKYDKISRQMIEVFKKHYLQ